MVFLPCVKGPEFEPGLDVSGMKAYYFAQVIFGLSGVLAFFGSFA